LPVKLRCVDSDGLKHDWNPPMNPDVSICIATFRRPDGLVRLLESLARQKLPEGLRVEVLVVDNDAAGDARSRAQARCDFAREVRWFVEPVQNIALARNRAVREARGKWLAFIDDDEVADEGWLAAFQASVEAGEGDGFFGPVLPRFDEIRSPWLDVERLFTRRRQATGTPVDARGVSTSNTLVRRALFDEHAFDPAWGRSGGSDFELFERMLGAGARFLWCDEAVVHETIPAARQRVAWLSQRAFRGGVGYTRLQRQRARPGALSQGLPRATLGSVALAALLPLSLLAGRSTALRVWLRLCTQVGHLWAFAGRSYEEYRQPAVGPVLE
jgi:succinoglycan biosynthesis protein ExoM